MDISKYPMKDVILAAMKAEEESRELYESLAAMARNAYLREKLVFLAAEERKHYTFAKSLFSKEFPKEKPVLPEASPVPMPSVGKPDPGQPMSVMLERAMGAEASAAEFYLSFSARVADPEVAATLAYFAAMERGHYRLLELEVAEAKRFEEIDEYQPLMHVGP